MTYIYHPAETVAAVRDDYRTGITVTEIANQHHMSTHTVSKWCQADRARHHETTRLPIWPLVQYMHDRPLTPGDILARTGINIYGELRQGWIGTYHADRIAVGLGCHVWDIYGDLWWQAALGDQWHSDEWEESA